MMYLIVPPIIVVIAIVFLLWYLLRKASDPLVQERVHELEGHKTTHFRGIKEWGLRLLEKFAQRSKNRSLKMHNSLHNWLQSIRASRKKVAGEKKQEEAYEEAREEEEYSFQEERQVVEQQVDSIEERVPQEDTKKSAFAIPLMRRHKRDAEERAALSTEQKTVVSERPMVSTKATLPENKKRSGKGGSPEEEMIGRIATNPKDFEAYEALGDFYMENGNIKDAKECYRQVLKLSPVQRMVKIKIRRLEKLLSQKSS
jgi:tetratricopeptide (TPR) repeat protein